MGATPHRRRGILGLVAAAGLAVLAWPTLGQAGSNPCGECHEEQARAFRNTLHEGPMAVGAGKNGCEACHGDGKAHMEDPKPENIRGPAALQKWTAREESAACLSCHGEVYRDKSGVKEGVHAGAGISCWDCHGEALHFQREGTAAADRPGPAASARRNPSERCLRCHEAQRTEFSLPYRHPVDRGQIRCWDCHDPHGPDLPTSGSPEAASTPCLTCHPAQKGPFVWRHLALDDGGCGACHKPHGSVNPRLLPDPGNGLCLKCHYETAFPQIGSVGHRYKLQRHARCLDCHTASHGSNVSDRLLR